MKKTTAPTPTSGPPVANSATTVGDDGKQPSYIVGIGASAGGLEALSTLFPNLPRDLGLAYVVVQHLSPTYRSMLAQLLGRETPMPVHDIEDGVRPQGNTVYITPPNRNVSLVDGRFRLVEPAREALPKPSVNLFLASLAEALAETSIGIILSGTGSDGAAGIHAVKAAGGLTFAQDPATAKYNGMPQAAIDTGCVDWILAPEKMGEEIAMIARNHGAVPVATQAASAPATLKHLFNRVRARTKVDFSLYKEATLWRRIERRMAANHVNTLQEYVDLTETAPEELDRLCKDILISVTAFFRDGEAFAALEKEIDALLLRKQPGDDIRVWVPGCATGEEAYSLAIIFAEKLGASFDQYRLQIFATDIDVDAMARARRGVFSVPSMAQMDRQRMKQHFTQRGDRYEIASHLRDVVLFARQDLVLDPPFLRLDLITCRNVLIYFQSELQARILSVFHYALSPGGTLFLGRSESIFQQENLFDVVDKESRIFRRSSGTARLPALRTEALRGTPPVDLYSASTARPRRGYGDILLDAAAQHFVPTSLLINDKFELRHVHGDVGKLLNIAAGKPAFDLISLLRREFRTEVQVLLRQAQLKKASAFGRVRRIKAVDPQRAVRLSVHPLDEGGGEALFMVCIEWLPPGDARLGGNDGCDISDRELEDELTATREHLQTVVEELETSNEEMQALNEEVQASNEELQSTNEELEASNEELQSTNEELTTVNDELQAKSAELLELNADLESIQNSVDYPLLVVDRRLILLRHNHSAAQLFRLNPASIGRYVQDIVPAADIPGFREDVEAVMRSQKSLDRQVLNADGRHYALHVAPLLRERGNIAGAIALFVDNTHLYEVQRSARENQERLLAVMNNSVSLIAVKDSSGRYQFVNPKFERCFNLAPGQAMGKTDFHLFPDPVATLFREAEIEVMRLRRDVERLETLHLGGSDRHFQVVRFPLIDDDGAINGICFQAADITDRYHAEEQLRLAARVFDRAAEGVVVTDASRVILTVNDAFTQVTGYSREDVLGRKPSLLRSGRHSPEFYEEMTRRLRDQGWWQGEIWNRRKNGDIYLEWLSINTVKGQHGEVVNYIGMFSDISLVKESHQRVEFLVTHDELTGLPNRVLFNDRLGLALARAERAGEPLCLLFVDLDNFKVINDTLGHEVGDRLLTQAAQRLRLCLRAEDTLARLGGDEFVLLLEASQKQDAALAAERMIAALSSPFVIDERECYVSASVGISVFPDDSRDAGGLMRNADTAMYRAKEQGKNTYQFFTSDLAERADQRLQLETGLRRAVEHGELYLKYQPQVDLKTGRVVGAEALVRWQRNGETIEPEVFIPVAEESTLIVRIEQWVIGEVCRQIKHWQAQGLPSFRIGVNVSARHFRRDAMVGEVLHLLSEAGVSPENLCLEMTERVLMDVERSERVLAELTDAGFHIGVDDFGTGYSSLSYLKRFRLNEIKIDRSFVDGIATDPDDHAIAAAIIAMAQSLGLTVIAEGVESEAQATELRAFACPRAQGFLFSEPLSPDAFADWVLARNSA